MSEILKAQDLFNINGWVTVVSGGGTGIGKMMAHCLAQNGAKVYITGRRLEMLKQTTEGYEDAIIPITGDVTKKEDIQNIVDEIKKVEDHVDLLVNNAGVTTVRAQIDAEDNSPEAISKRMFEQNFDDWLKPYAINTASIYFSTAAFIPLLLATKNTRGVSGNVINVTSVSGITKTSQNGQFSYNSNKAAARSLSSQLAYELSRPHINIRVNQIAFGYVPSQMTSIETEGEKTHFRSKWGIPFGRAGNIRDVSQLLLNLAVNEYMTDSTQVIDGGYLLTIP